MQADIPKHALCGYDGRIIYADAVTSAAYNALTDAKRTQVRHMLENDWQGRVDLECDSIEGLALVGGEFRVSDCVARSRLDFRGTKESPDVVIHSGHILVRGDLPEVVLNGLRRQNLERIINLPFPVHAHITSAANNNGIARIDYSDMTSFIIDELGTPHEKRPKGTKA